MKAYIRAANFLGRWYVATPPGLRWLFWAIPIIYFLSPIDLLPDILPIFRIDDLIFALLFFFMMERSQTMRDFFRNAKRAAKGKAPKDESETSPWSVLGVKRGATQQDIKRAYREQLKRYHPDKFAHMGEAYVDTAKRKTQSIVEAYQALKRAS